MKDEIKEKFKEKHKKEIEEINNQYEELMKDESIKEILDYISDRVIEKEKWNKVRDYITTLQEENEQLKQRIYKAIEYVRKGSCYGCTECWKLLSILEKDETNEGYTTVSNIYITECENFYQALLDIKEYIEKEWYWDGTGIDDILDIVNKALGDDKQ